jgi:hypothetical protein
MCAAILVYPVKDRGLANAPQGIWSIFAGGLFMADAPLK